MLKNNQPVWVSNIDELNADVFFLDVFGLLWNGNTFYDGVLEFLEKLNQFKKVFLLSNTTQVSTLFKETYAKRGLIAGVHYTDVVTSGDVLLDAVMHGFFENFIQKENYKVFILGQEHKPLMQLVQKHITPSFDDADCIYISGYNASDPDVAERVFLEQKKVLDKALERNIPCVCANPDLTYIAHNKPVKCQGSSGAYYQNKNGVVHFFGKPYADIFAFALQKANVSKEQTIMVGDTVETDVLGGHNFGIKTLLVTKTGVTGNLIGSQTIQLESLFQKHGASPDFVTDYFAQLKLEKN